MPKSNPYGLSSAGVFKEEPEASISAHEKGFMESLWSSIYENPGDVWYDEEGNMHNKSPVAHAVAAVDNILPGLPFVDVFPDPPDFEQPLAKLELATLYNTWLPIKQPNALPYFDAAYAPMATL